MADPALDRAQGQPQLAADCLVGEPCEQQVEDLEVDPPFGDPDLLAARRRLLGVVVEARLFDDRPFQDDPEDDATGPGGMGAFDGTDDQTIRWYDGDTLLEDSVGWQSSSIEVTGTAPQQLRVTNDVARGPQWRTSVSSSTEWTFWTEGPEEWQNLLPFVQVDFDVATDLTGTALSGTSDTIGFSAWNLPGTTGAGDITRAASRAPSTPGRPGRSWSSAGRPRTGSRR